MCLSSGSTSFIARLAPLLHSDQDKLTPENRAFTRTKPNSGSLIQGAGVAEGEEALAGGGEEGCCCFAPPADKSAWTRRYQ